MLAHGEDPASVLVDEFFLPDPCIREELAVVEGRVVEVGLVGVVRVDEMGDAGNGGVVHGGGRQGEQIIFGRRLEKGRQPLVDLPGNVGRPEVAGLGALCPGGQLGEVVEEDGKPVGPLQEGTLRNHVILDIDDLQLVVRKLPFQDSLGADVGVGEQPPLDVEDFFHWHGERVFMRRHVGRDVEVEVSILQTPLAFVVSCCF